MKKAQKLAFEKWLDNMIDDQDYWNDKRLLQRVRKEFKRFLGDKK